MADRVIQDTNQEASLVEDDCMCFMCNNYVEADKIDESYTNLHPAIVITMSWWPHCSLMLSPQRREWPLTVSLGV